MNKPELLVGFAVKLLLGFIYGYIFLHYYDGDDTWQLFRSSLIETQLLLNDPKQFFINEFTPANALATGNSVADVIEIYLNDLQYVLIVKGMAIMNLVTRGNYYLNSIFFNAITFFGHFWLFRLMIELFPAKGQFYFGVIFLFLPAVFWLSGIRVDGFLFFFLSMLLYYVCSKRKQILKQVAIGVIAFAGVAICRPQVAVLTGIGLIAFYLARKTGKPLVAFVTVYALAIVLFFASAFLLPGHGLPGVMAAKQQEFLRFQGTRFNIIELDRTPVSYLKALPGALANTFLRPFPWEAKGTLQMLASFEVLIFWAVVVTCLFRSHTFWKIRLYHPVILLFLFVSVNICLLVGYLVPFPGAIVRYRAIPQLLILCAVLSLTRWKEKSIYKNI
jgi:hypothetical protein